MFAYAAPVTAENPHGVAGAYTDRVRTAIDHATHYLPTQGPIAVFVHHNTLHALEHLPFETAVRQGVEIYGSEPYLSEERYREELRRGRIDPVNLRRAVESRRAEPLVAMHEASANRAVLEEVFGSPTEIELHLLTHDLHTASGPSLDWILFERKALDEFLQRDDQAAVGRAIEAAKRWRASSSEIAITRMLESRGIAPPAATSGDSVWKRYYLTALWHVCSQIAASIPLNGADVDSHRPLRHRDRLLSETGFDCDSMVNPILIQFCGCYCDQGFADWQIPSVDLGFARSFAALHQMPPTLASPWMRGLVAEFDRVLSPEFDPLASIIEHVDEAGVADEDLERFFIQTLLALPGWTGMLWQLESNSPFMPRPMPQGALLEYLAIRLILDRQAARWVRSGRLTEKPTSPASGVGGASDPERCDADAVGARQAVDSLTYVLFQLAQRHGWHPDWLAGCGDEAWRSLADLVHRFDSLERRGCFHTAYEAHYAATALSAFANHNRGTLAAAGGQPQRTPALPKFQVITCIDDREESFRRNLEETDPACETFAAAGFFAVAMYYKGATDAYFRPLCPNNILPKHFVCEEPVFTAEDEHQRTVKRQKYIGNISRRFHTHSRTLLGGAATALVGSLATFPLVARILAPHLTARVRSAAGNVVGASQTELHLERTAAEPGPSYERLGYSVDEMASIVVRILQDIALTKRFADLVLFLGHGSGSLNNPHESAYNCGACSGGRGGPNARSFASMANDPRVRAAVAAAGIEIPDRVHFVGGYHDTCSDRVAYFDLNRLPRTHRALFREVEQSIDLARRRNAHERSRRFESISLTATSEDAFEAVEQRSEDLSQARPEYNHAGNAMAHVGPREHTRGLFMDRRSFLVSYDSRCDGEDAAILARILAAAVPVCAGISLEYYFSTVDNEGYGCGSKLPHNIASLVGVMAGAASDLRTGLSAQMVEIHEPMRILFLIDTTPQIMLRIIAANETIRRMVENRWVQLAVYDRDDFSVQVYDQGEFRDFVAEGTPLPTARSSFDWYRGSRENLGFASIVASGEMNNAAGTTQGGTL